MTKVCPMKAKNLVLFIIGLLMSIPAYPIAWVASIGLAYVMSILGLVFGVFIVVKRSSKVDIILGIILILISIGSLGLTAITHAVVSGVEKAVKEAFTTKNITVTLGQRVVAGSWAITVLKVDTPEYVEILLELRSRGVDVKLITSDDTIPSHREALKRLIIKREEVIEKGNEALVAIGLFFFIASFMLFFINIILGFIALVLGLIFMIAGGGKYKTYYTSVLGEKPCGLPS